MIKLRTIREVFSAAQMKKAIAIAKDSSGNYDKAFAAIEKIRKGLGDEHIVAAALKKANEGVDIEEGRADIKKAFLKGPKTTGKDVEKELKKVKNGSKLSIQHSKGLGRSGIGGGDVISVKGDKVTIKPTASNGATVIDVKDITSMTLMKESVDLEEGAPLAKKDGYDVQATGKSSVGVQLVLSYKGKAIAQGSKMKGDFVFGFKHNDVHPNARYEPDNMVKKGKDHTHIAFKTPEEVIAFAKTHKIIKEDTVNEGRDFVVVHVKYGKLEIKNASSSLDAAKKAAKKWKVPGGKTTGIDAHLAEAVDCRTKGYKEAVARSLLLKTKREAKKIAAEEKKQKEMEEEIANSTGVNIAGVDKPLGKVKKRKSFKESLIK